MSKYQSMLDVMSTDAIAQQVEGEQKGRNRIRKCGEIGLFVLDRSCKNCVFHTPFCALHCYCLKQYVQYPDMLPSDSKNEAFWKALTPQSFREMMGRKRTQETRFRYATRGEMLSTIQDVLKVRDIALECPQIDFWIPTRAWRSDVMLWAIKHYLEPLPNVHVLCSLDPSNTVSEFNRLVNSGLSCMFFGNDDQDVIRRYAEAAGYEYVACSKTWEHKKAACRDCDRGCFQSKQGRFFIHLKEH